MYYYDYIVQNGGAVYGYVWTSLQEPTNPCPWSGFCWDEYTSYAEANLYLDNYWLVGYWYSQPDNYAYVWVQDSVAVGEWVLEAKNEVRNIWYRDNYNYSWFEFLIPYIGYPTLTIAPEISISGAQYVDDGGTGYFSVTAQGGSPTQYEWSYDYDSGGGNYPNVDFSDPWSSSTLTDGHWYASPDDACSADRQAQYLITARVEFQNPVLTLYDTTSLNVVLPEIGGTTYGPSLTPHIWTEPANGQWIVSPKTYFVRSDPVVLKAFTSESQFWEKVVAHEDVHVDQYMPGGAYHLNEDLFNPTVARNLIIGLTDATQEGLDVKIIQAYNPWIQNQANEDNYVRRADAEAQAYAASDSIAPPYKYQSQCGAGL